MKHFLLITLVLPFLVIPWASTQAQGYDDDPISAGILGTFQGSGAYEIHPLDWFKNTYEDLVNEPVKKPKDIYLFMYKQAKEKPHRDAVNRTVERYKDLSKEDIEKLKRGEMSNVAWYLYNLCKGDVLRCPPVLGPVAQLGDYILGPILRRLGQASERSARAISDTTDIFKFKPDQVAAAFDIFRDEFNEELEVASLEAELESETVITEIFANGDESDSGFDLLVDLEVIKLILFGEPVTLPGPSGPGAPPGANEIKIGARALEEQQALAAAQAAAALATAQAGQPGVGAGPGAPSGVGVSPAGTPALPEAAAIRPFTPLECYADQNFDSQIRGYRRSQGLPESRGVAETPAPALAGGERRATQPGVPEEERERDAQERLREEEEIETPAIADAWARGGLCPPGDQLIIAREDPFWCLTLEAKIKRESSYLPTDNCIACHIEKINDAFRKTLKSNLTPGKATGLPFALPMCKSNLDLPSLLDRNVIFLRNPIITPPNDNIVVDDIFLGNIEKFMKRYIHPGVDFSGVLGDGTVPEDFTEQASERVSSQLGRGRITGATAEIQAEVAAERERALKIIETEKNKAEVANIQEQFKVLYPEIERMTNYFVSFGKLYEDILVEDGPCDTLLNKKGTCQ